MVDMPEKPNQNHTNSKSQVHQPFISIFLAMFH